MRARLVERRVSAELPAGVAGGEGERRGLLLVLEDDGGLLGLGEASPLPGYSPDAFEDVRAALAARVDAPWPSLDEGPVAAARRLGAGLDGLPSARFALETAWLGAVASRRGCSLAALLGGRRERVPLASLVEAVDVDAAVAEARAATARGVRTLKLKLATAAGLAADLDRATAVRAAVGPGIHLRFDANGRLTVAEVGSTLERLADLDAELLEEPLPTGDLLASAARLVGSPVRLALDESLHRPATRAAAWSLVERQIVGAVVLKPACLSLLGALDLAMEAAEAGVPVFVTHLFDGPVALAAASQLALALPGEVLACAVGRHRGLDAWPSAAFAGIEAADVVATGEPGLGLVLAGGLL